MNQKPYRPFVVDENPFCLWDIDIAARNRELLDKIDSEYFRHVAEINSEILENSDDKEKRQYASISLRIAYSHGLEALFSLLGASVQAPDCVVGWLLKYRPGDVPSIVEKITNGQALWSNFDPAPSSWKDVSAIVLSPIENTDIEKYNFLVEKFARTWERFAYDYLDPDFHEEYNSVKHGFRVKASGFYFAIDPKNSRDGTGNFIEHANSEFGMSYFKQEKLDTRNFTIAHQGNNWHPMNYAYALSIIATSIRNTTLFLRVTNGVDWEGLSVMYPDDPASFDKPWEIQQSGAHKMTFSHGRFSGSIPLLSAEQILSRYPQSVQKPVDNTRAP
jgi:hypothetical protein